VIFTTLSKTAGQSLYLEKIIGLIIQYDLTYI